MESLEDIEKALTRLVPSAISEKGQQSLEDLIDGLAVEAGEVPELVAEPEPEPLRAAPKRRIWSWTGGIAAAAAAVVAAMVLPQVNPGAVSRATAYQGNITPVSHPATEDGILLLGQTERVEAAEPEEWVSEANGVPHRAWRCRVVNEERVQDVKTGYEVTVSRPLEKVVLMPVTAF
ncbi:hypothetical protein [Luteolibacter luteus]|uniref:Uncharacterized protein n=1 Tax=Luteolibacter luteus TaxID=2728835 RepID=A0A858RPP0_9BACT|nr:hypothetical protein [Luteolibacter luteus]QJE98358.1 hypothetical protein HHL09_22085 [Luteolibacter luteus]